MVDIVGETRADVKVLNRKMDRLEQKVDKQGSDIAVLKADNAEIKEMLSAILSRLPND